MTVVNVPTTLDLTQLQQQCLEQIDSFKRGTLPDDAFHCTEIIRRAARGERDALTTMLSLSEGIIHKKCSGDLYHLREDIAQEVSYRLIRKFNGDNPYRATNFAGYMQYLNLIIRSVVSDSLSDAPPMRSWDELAEEQGIEPDEPFPAAHVEARLLLQRCLDLLEDPLEKETFRLRYGMSQLPDDITESLQSMSPGITKEEVYRLMANALRRLRKFPEFQQDGSI